MKHGVLWRAGGVAAGRREWRAGLGDRRGSRQRQSVRRFPASLDVVWLAEPLPPGLAPARATRPERGVWPTGCCRRWARRPGDGQRPRSGSAAPRGVGLEAAGLLKGHRRVRGSCCFADQLVLCDVQGSARPDRWLICWPTGLPSSCGRRVAVGQVNWTLRGVSEWWCDTLETLRNRL